MLAASNSNMLNETVSLLVAALSDDGTPTLPLSGRESVLNLLKQVLVSEDLLREYTCELYAEEKAQGVFEVVLGQVRSELPIVEIVEKGLEVLSDEQLAQLAVDPGAVVSLSELLIEEVNNPKLALEWHQLLAAEPTCETV